MAYRNKRQRANVREDRTGAYKVLSSDWSICMSVTSARVSDYVIGILTAREKVNVIRPAEAYGITTCVYAVTYKI